MIAYITYIPILILLIILGIFIYRKNSSSKVNRYFSYFILSIFLWVFALLFADTVKEYDPALFWNKMAIIGPSLIVYFFLLFAKVFPTDEGDFKKIYKLILVIPALIIIVLSPTSLNVEKIILRSWGAEVVVGPLYLFLLVYYVVFLFLAFYILIKKYKKSMNLVRNQIRYIFLGMGISSILGLTTNLVLLFFNISQYSLLGPISMLFFIGFTTYAILRYRLMDIRVIIRRSAVFTSLVLLITAIYAILAFILSLVFTDIFGVSSLILNGIVMAILVALGFEPLKKWLSEVTDSFLFKAEYKPQEVIAEFSDRLSSTLDLNTLTDFITQKTESVFKCTRVSLFLLDKDENVYKQAAMAGINGENQTNTIDKELFARVFNFLHGQNLDKEIIAREELRKTNEQMQNKVLDSLLAEMDKYEVNLIVPIYVKNELVGLLFYGDKKSGDVYSNEDIRMLQIIASQSGVAMQNARLYQEQKNFAVKLTEEVDKATKELKVANAQLKKLDVAKSEFISIASHQLRTPLTVIKGYLSMIQQKDFGEVPEKLANPLDKVFKSTLRIIGLVEDLLNVSRIESGRMKYDFEMVDPDALATEVFEELEQHAKSRGLQFTYVKPTKKIPALKLDRNKVREVFMNLMDNALKYTEKGFVTVQLEKLDGHVRFSVKDSGRGIAPDEMPELFQKFSRAKGVQLVHTEGTGLGLYIAKKIMQKHHAKIWAESEGNGKGSSFIIEFKV